MKDTKLRLWPGIAAGALIVIGFTIGILLNLALPDIAAFGILGAVIGMLAVVVWWLFFSRAPWSERLGGIAAMIVVWFAMRPFLDKSILGGTMGALPVLAFPVLAVGLVGWAAVTRNLSGRIRPVSMAAAILIACIPCTLVRTEGLRGGFSEFHWRWTPTPEELLLAQSSEDFAPIPPAPAAEVSKEAPAAKATDDDTAPPPVPVPRKPAEWPGFRGPQRDGVVHDVRIETDWSKSPPAELWRRPIGPGWSSFAVDVDADAIYTQEQRGDDEIVASYSLSTGKPIWKHRDAVRFYESNGGAGPRGTPTLHNGRVYTFGGTGLLNALDAATGAVFWSRNVSAEAGVEVPEWGFSSSPLVIGDLVVAAATGRLAAYDIATGKQRWVGPAGGFSYSSPHLMTIDGIPQIVHLRAPGAAGFSPADGALLWQHELGGGAIVQPALTVDGNILVNGIGMGGGEGIRRLAITNKSGAWKVEERWASTGLKPYFNDFAVHNGHAYGFDGTILSCVDLADGTRKWKGGRYGGGQLVLLADQGLLLVLSDEGEIALVSAAPDGFKELARFKAIEGKTWNHPVVVRDTLLVRNGEEMAAFRLTTTQSLR